MHKKITYFCNDSIAGKLFIHHLIFFFIVTPFLFSCSGSGSSGGKKSAYNGTTVAESVASQYTSAEKALSGAVDMASAIDTGCGLIEEAFGTDTPDPDDIEAFVKQYPAEAANLLKQFTTLDGKLQTAADDFSTSMKELKELESTLSDSLGSLDDEAAELTRSSSRAIGLVGGALVILTVIGAVAAAGKGAADAIHECDSMPECNPMPPANDSRFAECMKWQAEKLACIIQKWPKAATDAIKGTISNGVTTVSSWAAGIQEWKTVQFLIEAYSAYDDVDSIHKAFGIRRCDETSGSKTGKQRIAKSIRAIDVDSLTPDDIYIGTSEDGTFHNVPEGEWSFLLFEEGHLRKTSLCVDATGASPVQSRVTIVPVEALSDDDTDGYSEIQGDCNDQNPAIHPGAPELCSDGVDNNCNKLIDCYDSECASHESCEAEDDNEPSELSLSVTVSIPGYGKFAPNFKIITMGDCDNSIDRYIIPTLYASTGGDIMHITTSDVFTLIFNNDMGTGAWDMGYGPCDTPMLFFSTSKIMDPVTGLPVTFGSDAGTVTFQAYGTQYGERLTGVFDFDVWGDQCLDDECEEEREITGTITGSFDGVITRYP